MSRPRPRPSCGGGGAGPGTPRGPRARGGAGGGPPPPPPRPPPPPPAVLGPPPPPPTTAAAVVETLRGLPWVLRERRVLPPQVEAGLVRLEESQRRSVARRYVG
ncbi:hypothetical protein [Nocardia asiatica]|uniref:hypothetical protein n=1 Tax=Nocardia asiatica TaxID=209252 RepID=UPI00245500EE|nr:hypothetical protein [Nocardia asiatica]